MEKSFAFVIQLQVFEISIKGEMFDLLNEQKTFSVVVICSCFQKKNTWLADVLNS